MRLIYDKPRRPQDVLVLAHGERKDSAEREVRSGGEFEVSDKRGRELLALLPDEVREAPQAAPADTPKAVKRPRRAKTAKPSK